MRNVHQPYGQLGTYDVDGDKLYGRLGPNSNTFARYLLGAAPLPSGAPRDTIRPFGAPGLNASPSPFFGK